MVRQRDLVIIHSGRSISQAGLGVILFSSLITRMHTVAAVHRGYSVPGGVASGLSHLPPSQQPRELLAVFVNTGYQVIQVRKLREGDLPQVTQPGMGQK